MNSDRIAEIIRRFVAMPVRTKSVPIVECLHGLVTPPRKLSVGREFGLEYRALPSLSA